MKLLLDLFPVVAFFAAFRVARSIPEAVQSWVTALVGPVHATGLPLPELVAVVFATLVAIAATVLQIALLLLRRHPIKPMVWVSAALIIVFGGLTIWLQNEWFIKSKPTLLYWIFALVLLGAKLLTGRNLLGSVLTGEITLPPAVWDRLLYAWGAFFAVLGALNLAVAWMYSTDTWVTFKTVGLFGLTLVFSIGSAALIARHAHDAPDA